MSTRRTHGFELPVDADRWLSVYLDDAYTRALHVEGLSFERFELLESRSEGDLVVHRRVQATPPMDAPRVVQKALGGAQQYEERGNLDLPSRTWRYTVIPAAMADKITITGLHRVVALGPDRCRAEFEAEFAVSIFGVGRAIERFMAGQFDDNIRRQETFARQYLTRG
ncbi:MAG: hypothetical protein ACI9WU_001753 [Myxococcota bacterium]